MNGSGSPRSMRGAQRRSNPGRLKVRMPLSETLGAPFARLTQRRGEEGGAKGLVCGYAENPWRAPTSPRRRPGPRPANESEPLRGALNKGLDPGLRRGDARGFAQRRKGRKGFSAAAGAPPSQVAFDGAMASKGGRAADATPSRLPYFFAPLRESLQDRQHTPRRKRTHPEPPWIASSLHSSQ